MIYDSDKKLLKRYRHIIAALRAIKDFKNNTPNFCEWYLDIAWKRGTNTDDDLLDINRNIIKATIKYRRCSDFKFALNIGDNNIAGYESLGASWF